MQVEQKSDDAIDHSSLHIINIDPLADPRWEALMQDSPASVIYQHPAWLRTLEEAYGYKALHLACEDSVTGQLQGILPLFSRWGVRTGHLSTSVFDSPIAGPLATNEQANKLLIQAAVKRTRLERGSQFQMKVLSTDFDQLVYQVSGVPLFETYQLALPEHPDRLRLDSRIKWSVNKATRLGVRVRPAETERELQLWYELYLQTMRHLVAIPKPYRFFQAVWRHLHPRGLLHLLLAEHVEASSSRIISGFLFLQWGQTISHIFTGWRREDQALRPNDLLHWHAIRSASEQGLRWYDFGNVRVGDQGLAQFKSKWGAEAKLIYRYAYPTSPHRSPSPGAITSHSAPTIASQAKSSVIRRRVASLWQRLPLKTIEWVGNGCTALHYY